MDIKEFFRKIISRFNKKKLIDEAKDDSGQRPGDVEYQNYAKSVDDLGIASMFVREFHTKEFDAFERSFLSKGKLKDYPYRTTINASQAKELARDFFTSINPQFSHMANDILDGLNEDISLSFVENNGKNRSDVNAPNHNNKHLSIRVVESDSIVMLYELVHEMTHTFDTEKGDTTTRRLYGEIAPQSMERLLDEYLLSMPEEQMQKYNIDKETLKKDVLDRKIATFLSRYHNADARTANKTNMETANRYMFAQLFVTQFEEMDRDKKIESLCKLMDAIKNNDFEAASQAYGMHIDKENEIQRRICIDALKKNVDQLVEKKQTELADGPTDWHLVNLGLGKEYKSFYHETTFEPSHKKFDDDPDKRADLIITKDGEIVGVCEMDILPGGIARMCKQEEMNNLGLPMGIDDSKNITNGNDMPAIQVSPEQKGKGLGRKMLEMAIQYAKANRASRLSIEQISLKAKSFYEEFGIQYKDDFNGEIDLEADKEAKVGKEQQKER